MDTFSSRPARERMTAGEGDWANVMAAFRRIAWEPVTGLAWGDLNGPFSWQASQQLFRNGR